jgi:hypothetical protein
MTAGNRGEWRDSVGELAASLPGLEGLRGLFAQCSKCGCTASATERRSDSTDDPTQQIPGLALEQPLERVIATAERRWHALQDRARRSGRKADAREADSFLRGLRRLQDANKEAQPVHAGCGGRLNLYRLKEPNQW